MKKTMSLLLVFALIITILFGCSPANEPVGSSSVPETTSVISTSSSENSTEQKASTTTSNPTTTTKLPSSVNKKPSASQSKVTTTKKTDTSTKVTTSTTRGIPTINGVKLEEYSLVYSKKSLDYTVRAVAYIQERVMALTGIRLPIVTDEQQPTAGKHEIVVGETNRSISKSLNATTKGLEFAFLANNGHVAMEGDCFVIAAAAYYFVERYVNGETAAAVVPQKVTIQQPIVETPKHFFILIGDGMGELQTRLFEQYKATEYTDYSDGENVFYGYLFPYIGTATTNSLTGSGLTDSAAAGTALATGYKTTNGRIGRDGDNKDLLSITELAGASRMATAVMSTESQTGATPAAFSAHADDRGNSTDILKTQKNLVAKYKTIISCDFNWYNASLLKGLEKVLNNTLDTLYSNDYGSFMMYEEAYIDKHCHNKDAENTFKALVRFNQTIGQVMEQAFYHPDTLVVITADHETGYMMENDDGSFKYAGDTHSTLEVPVFAYGKGAEVFDGRRIANVQIPKTIAPMFGKQLAKDTDYQYPPLTN